MSVRTIEEIKADIWSLDTVEIRKVLRYLNNTVRRTISPTLLASAKHEVCHQKLIAYYTPEQLEKALLWHETERETLNNENTSPIERPEFRLTYEEPPSPSLSNAPQTDSVTEALTRPIMAKVATLLAQAFTNLGSHPALLQVKKDVAVIVTDAMKPLFTRVIAVEDALMASQNTNLTITFPEENRIEELGLVHKDTAKLIKFLSSGMSVFMTGPSGSGKSIGAEKAAKALGLEFYSISVCSQTTKTELLGYLDATGTYRETQFRKAYEHGGLYLFDEIDAGNANVLAVLNNALSNSKCPFPDKMVLRHDKFRCVAAGNTWGTGKTIQYVGRNALDAATLNRFAVIFWDYDEALETKLAKLPMWSKYVQECRAEIKRRGVNYLITPRASIYGATLLRQGVTVKEVIETVLAPNLDPEILKAFPPAPVISI
jgi:cobaltochelatase CobS